MIIITSPTKNAPRKVINGEIRVARAVAAIPEGSFIPSVTISVLI